MGKTATVIEFIIYARVEVGRGDEECTGIVIILERTMGITLRLATL